MSWTTILAIYFIVWWLVLFTVLPWGVRSQHEAGDITPGTDPGAPAMPSLGYRLGDDQVAAVVTYVRNSWGNAASPVTAEMVRALRGQVSAARE